MKSLYVHVYMFTYMVSFKNQLVEGKKLMKLEIRKEKINSNKLIIFFKTIFFI
jgi:hypothetical protein